MVFPEEWHRTWQPNGEGVGLVRPFTKRCRESVIFAGEGLSLDLVVSAETWVQSFECEEQLVEGVVSFCKNGASRADCCDCVLHVAAENSSSVEVRAEESFSMIPTPERGRVGAGERVCGFEKNTCFENPKSLFASRLFHELELEIKERESFISIWESQFIIPIVL